MGKGFEVLLSLMSSVWEMATILPEDVYTLQVTRSVPKENEKGKREKEEPGGWLGLSSVTKAPLTLHLISHSIPHFIHFYCTPSSTSGSRQGTSYYTNKGFVSGPIPPLIPHAVSFSESSRVYLLHPTTLLLFWLSVHITLTQGKVQIQVETELKYTGFIHKNATSYLTTTPQFSYAQN